MSGESPRNARTHVPRALALIALLLLFASIAGAASTPNGPPRANTESQVATAKRVWFAPFPKGTPGAPWQEGFGSTDFMSLFSWSAPWGNAASRVTVFKLYAAWVNSTSNTNLRILVYNLASRGISLALEAPGLSWTASCGEGVPAMVSDAPAVTLSALDRIARVGGSVRYVAIDEPLAYGSVYAGPAACNYTPQQVGAQVAAYTKAVSARYRSVAFGVIEPDWAPIPAVGDYLAAYRTQRGTPFAFLHWDADVESGGDWMATARQAEALARRLGIPFGMIYFGRYGDTSSDAWLRSAEDAYTRYETAGGGNPADIVLQSWHRYPERVLPETGSDRFTNLIVRYFRKRSTLTAAVSDAKVSGVLKTSSGVLAARSVKVTITPLAGSGAYAEYRITGTVPPGVSQAVIGFRANSECGCAGTTSFRLYGLDATSAGQPLLQPYPFADAARWSSWGSGVGAVTSDRGAGTMLQVNTTDGAGLNSERFAVQPGTPFEFVVRAAVDPASYGSGYFALIFVTPTGDIRARIPFAAPAVTVAATTDSRGAYTATLPVTLPARFVLEASYAGDSSTWGAFAILRP